MRTVVRGGLVEQVIDQLAAEITTGRLSAGDRLPSVVELAEQLGVGRSTIREAVQALAHRGVLAVHQGRGTFVAEAGPDPDQRRTWLQRAAMLDLYEARRGLEVDAARLAALRRTPADRAAVAAAAEERRRARLAGVVGEWAAADIALHRSVLTATHNAVLIGLFDELSAAMADAFEHQTADRESTVDTADEHDALARAVEVGDPDAAMRATTAYLDACGAELRDLLGGDLLGGELVGDDGRAGAPR